MAKKPVTDEAIGTLVRERRRAAGVTQPQLGDAIGVKEQMIQKYEKGVSPLTVVKLVTIARTIGCRTIDLIPGEGA